MNKYQINQCLALVNHLDGYGLVATDDDLLKERLKELKFEYFFPKKPAKKKVKLHTYEISQEDLRTKIESKRKLTEKEEENLDGKCGGCNWTADHLFVEAKTLKQAEALVLHRYDGDGAGMCGDCYSEYMAGRS